VDEAAWLACRSPGELMRMLGAAFSFRKSRLVACACVRRVWHLLTHDQSRQAVLFMEERVDSPGWEEAQDIGNIPATEYDPDTERLLTAQAAREVFDLIPPGRQHDAHREAANAAYRACADEDTEETDLEEVCEHAARAVSNARCPDEEEGERTWQLWFLGERAIQADLVREIVGNPFRPVAINPDWLAANDGLVVSLARTIYDERAFERMPILGDALEDAGCADPTILDHCRRVESHPRGCWLLDLILGRS
jgi:hypothetical protein